MKRTTKSVSFLNDDGYDSDNLKRVRLNPKADEAYEEFLKDNNIVDPESAEADIAPLPASSTRAKPLEAPERALDNEPSESDNASSTPTEVDDAKAKELKAWVL